MTDLDPLPNLALFWAKLRRTNDPTPYHPLICHMADVAATTLAMWDSVLSPAARGHFAETLALGKARARLWVAFLGGLHDLGKASPAFQLRPAAQNLQHLYATLPRPIGPAQAPHGTVTTDALGEILVARLGVAAPAAWRLATIVGGHHGLFPRSVDLERLDRGAVGLGAWREVRAALVEALRVALDVPSSVPSDPSNAGAMELAGLVSVADWIGSDETHFPYAASDASRVPEINLPEYLTQARQRASRALSRLGWSGWTPGSARLDFAQLFPKLRRPRAVQECVQKLARSLETPALVIVEAPMGEGKTEAALLLADHWGVEPGPRGFFVALPTQATSNQMFGRVREFLARRYPAEVVNLQLLHGHASLSAEFQALRRAGGRLLDPTEVGVDSGKGKEGIVAAEWFTHRKRGLLAPFGVGTVDQALLAALQTRHVFVRMFGLAHRVVIVDEVHAYDAYMSTLLERLMEWLATLRSPVIMLSATLPRARRDALLRAYARGLETPRAAGRDTPYPRVTWSDRRGVGSVSVPTSPQSARVLGIRWLDSAERGRRSVAELLDERLADGGCAAVICNTVGRAQKVYQALKSSFRRTASDGLPELDLLHARYLHRDREERERRTLVRFGQPAGSVRFADDAVPVRRPDRAVLVATQVIEQSLDLDFDLMVSDLAPLDLLLQRAGRLHRHERARPAALRSPCLWVTAPSVAGDGTPRFEGGDKTVYDPHILLRTWLALHDRQAVTVPEEMDALIEAVYGDATAPSHLTAPQQELWHSTREDLEAKLEQMESRARNVAIPPPDCEDVLETWNRALEEDQAEIDPSLQALTRVTDGPRVSVVCLPAAEAEASDGTTSAAHAALALLAQSVVLSDRRLVYRLLALDPPTAWRRSALLRHHRLLPLDDTESWRHGRWRLRVDAELGVVIEDAGGEQD
jgi:CRISPR-associated endonuclease/helicase Cas3